MLAVFKREFKSSFMNMTAPVFLALILVFAGIFSMSLNLLQGYASFEYVLSNLEIVLLLLIPVLAMRSFSEEKKNRTDQLLYSLPISTTSVVLGKYLAMLSVLGISCLAMALIPIVLSLYGTVYFAGTYSALLGFFLLGAALTAICMFLSSLTESQLIAAVSGFGTMLLLYLMSALSSLLPSDAKGSLLCFVALSALLAFIVYTVTKNIIITLGAAILGVGTTLIFYSVTPASFEGLFPKLLGYLAVFDRLSSFIYGIFDLSAVVYFLSVSVFFVFLSVQSMEKRRWS